MQLEPTPDSRGRALHHTYRAVQAQVAAMAVPEFEIGVKEPAGRIYLRRWTASEILAALRWLRHKNASGSHIYVRPASSHGVILLDDLDHLAIDHLRSHGLPPAAVVETSPGNFQCWLRLIHNREHRHLSPTLIRQALQHLVLTYGADPNCADWRHFGRLAGFTNQKPCHVRPSGPPYVLLHFAAPIVAPLGRELLIRSRAHLRRDDHRQIPPVPSPPRVQQPSYLCRMKHLLQVNAGQSWVTNPDYSRLDFMIAREMLMQGYTTEQIAHEIRTASPRITIRKAGHVEDYVNRTVQSWRGEFRGWGKLGRDR